MHFNYEKLKVYDKGNDFVNQIYNITKKFPKEEMYGLTSQLRRSAVSIILNIAEGTTIGYKRLLRVSNTTAEKVRVKITKSIDCPVFCKFSLYRRPMF